MNPLNRRIIDLFTGLNLEAPPPDADLFETGVLDSVTFVDLLLRMERDFGVRCSLEEVDLDSFRSVNRIAQFIERSANPPKVAV